MASSRVTHFCADRNQPWVDGISCDAWFAVGTRTRNILGVPPSFADVE